MTAGENKEHECGCDSVREGSLHEAGEVDKDMKGRVALEESATVLLSYQLVSCYNVPYVGPAAGQPTAVDNPTLLSTGISKGSTHTW